MKSNIVLKNGSKKGRNFFGVVNASDKSFEELKSVTNFTWTAGQAPLLLWMEEVIPLVARHDVVGEVHDLGDAGLEDSVVVLAVEEPNDLNVAFFLPKIALSDFQEESKDIPSPVLGDKVDPIEGFLFGTTRQAFIHVWLVLVLVH